MGSALSSTEVVPWGSTTNSTTHHRMTRVHVSFGPQLVNLLTYVRTAQADYLIVTAVTKPASDVRLPRIRESIAEPESDIAEGRTFGLNNIRADDRWRAAAANASAAADLDETAAPKLSPRSPSWS